MIEKIVTNATNVMNTTNGTSKPNVTNTTTIVLQEDTVNATNTTIVLAISFSIDLRRTTNNLWPTEEISSVFKLIGGRNLGLHRLSVGVNICVSKNGTLVDRVMH